MPSASLVLSPPAGAVDGHLNNQSGPGDAAALGELYDRHGARAYRIATTICLDPFRSERAVEHAFLDIGGGAPARHADIPVVVWLLMIVHRLATAEARDSGQAYSPFPGLTRGQAEILSLAHLGELTATQIADGLGATTQGIKRLITEALHDLRRHATE